MAELRLGHRAPSIVVSTYTGSRYYQAFQYPGGANWPAGYELTLVFTGGTTWTATNSGNLAEFDQSASSVNAVADNTAVVLWLKVDATHTYKWAQGVVEKDRPV